MIRYGQSFETSIGGGRCWSTCSRASRPAIAKSARLTGRSGPLDDLVHPAAARGHERFAAGVEDGGKTVGAEAGVRAEAAVVEHRELVALVAVAPVGDPVRILVALKPISAWVPSQSGFSFDSPQRQSAICGPAAPGRRASR